MQWKLIWSVQLLYDSALCLKLGSPLRKLGNPCQEGFCLMLRDTRSGDPSKIVFVSLICKCTQNNGSNLVAWTLILVHVAMIFCLLRSKNLFKIPVKVISFGSSCTYASGYDHCGYDHWKRSGRKTEQVTRESDCLESLNSSGRRLSDNEAVQSVSFASPVQFLGHPKPTVAAAHEHKATSARMPNVIADRDWTGGTVICKEREINR